MPEVDHSALGLEPLGSQQERSSGGLVSGCEKAPAGCDLPCAILGTGSIYLVVSRRLFSRSERDMVENGRATAELDQAR